MATSMHVPRKASGWVKQQPPLFLGHNFLPHLTVRDTGRPRIFLRTLVSYHKT